MIPIRNYSRVLLAFAAVLLTACESPAQKPSGSSTSPQRRMDAPAMVSIDTLALAYRQFAAFLTIATATRKPKMGVADSVYTPGEIGIGEQDADMRWVAASRILSIKTEGDTGSAVAVITTVARQIDNGNGVWLARYGIHEDTARWFLVRNAATGGRWMVEGDAAGGFGVFHIGRERDIKWVVGSRAKALAAVDSIRRARGLELVR
jgi:hypothetical protein